MMNPSTLSDSIQLAVAPVFLLTAVAGMIGALTQRLARVIDRARVIHKEMSDASLSVSARGAYEDELMSMEHKKIPFYERIPTVSTNHKFIECLKEQVRRILKEGN